MLSIEGPDCHGVVPAFALFLVRIPFAQTEVQEKTLGNLLGGSWVVVRGVTSSLRWALCNPTYNHPF